MNALSEFDSEFPSGSCPCGCRGNRELHEAFESGLTGEVGRQRRFPRRPPPPHVLALRGPRLHVPGLSLAGAGRDGSMSANPIPPPIPMSQNPLRNRVRNPAPNPTAGYRTA